jgi:hypothetical protein
MGSVILLACLVNDNEEKILEFFLSFLMLFWFLS